MTKGIVFKLVGLTAIIAFILVSLGFTTVERKQIVFSNMDVVFHEPYQFVTDGEIEMIVLKRFKGLNGALLDTVNTEKIEDIIEENPWVKNAEVFKGYVNKDSFGVVGGLKIYIEQEVPVFRVVEGAEGFYVSNNGKHLPYSSSHTTNVTVYTGCIDDKKIMEELLPFEKAIDIDPFFNALIEQVDVRSNGELVLVPRVGSHLIEFGKVEDVRNKFDKLKAVYKKGFNVEDWKKYKTVSLKYNNQVVCTLK